MKSKKAPVPDGLPAEVLKAVARSHPELLLRMYKSCLKTGVFYSRWKEARLVLIGKGKELQIRLPLGDARRQKCLQFRDVG